MFFQDVKPGPVDPIFHLKASVKNDTHPDKVDLGIGVYRNEYGEYHEMEVLKKAKEYLVITNPPHDYETTTGSPELLQHAAGIVFGKDSKHLSSGKVASAQTISGTGAVHIGAMFLKHGVPNMRQTVYIGTPAWGNYQPLFHVLGYEIHTYTYYDRQKQEIDFNAVLNAVQGAPRGSIFVLQGCCHNPVAIDFTHEQWRTLAAEIRSHGHLPFFDIAYQGLGSGIDADGFAVRHFAESGELIVAQSFSKNFGLYGERVGAIHVVASSADAATCVKDQLRSLIRWEFSNPPRYGSRLVTRVLSDPVLEANWHQELETIRLRLDRNRQELYRLLTEVYKTCGNWSCISWSTGLFSFLPLYPTQVQALQKLHIHLITTGRINLSGLNDNNTDRVARAIDTVVRNEGV